MRQRLAIGMALLAGLFCTAAYPLGLGEIQVNSRLNQPLSATLPLYSLSEEDAESLRVQLASQEDFDKAGIQLSDYLSTLRFTVSGTRVKISSDQIAREPVVALLIEARAGSSRVLRGYTVLLDLPSVGASAESTSATPQDAAPGSDQSSSAPSAAQTYGPIRAGQTFWSVASRLRPDPALVSMDQTLLALYTANPQAFIGGIDGLLTGSTLKVPSVEQMQKVPEAEARRRVRALRMGQPPVAVARPVPAPEVKAETPIPEPTPEPAAPVPVAEAVAPPSPEIAAPASSGEPAAAAEAPAEAAPAEAAAVPPPAAAPPMAEPLAVAPTPAIPQPKSYLLIGLPVLLVLALLALLILWRRRRAAVADAGPAAASPAAPAAPVLAAAAVAETPVAASQAEPEPAAEMGAVEAAAPIEAEPVPEEPVAAEASEPEAVIDDDASTDIDLGGSAESALDHLDPLAEADFHLSYGLYDEAVRGLLDAIAAEPGRSDLQIKLAETYFAAGRPADFEALASQIQPQLSPSDWNRLAFMGSQLCPDSPLFRAEIEAEAEPEPEPEADHRQNQVDFAPDPVIEAPAESPAAAAPKVDNLLEFELSEFDASAPIDTSTWHAPAQWQSKPAPARAPDVLDLADPAVPAAEELRLIDLEPQDIDLYESEPEPEIDIATDDEVGTKLDLARAYLDMGDKQMARDLLSEVIVQGNAAQQADARSLLLRLPP